MHDRSAGYARVLWAAAVPLLLVISVESGVVRPDLLGHAIQNPFWWLGLLLVCATAITLISGLVTRHEMRAFIGSNLLLAGLPATGAAAIFPVVLHSTLAPKTRSPFTTSLLVVIHWSTPRSGGRSALRWRPRILFSSRDNTPAKSASNETTRVSTEPRERSTNATTRIQQGSLGSRKVPGNKKSNTSSAWSLIQLPDVRAVSIAEQGLHYAAVVASR